MTQYQVINCSSGDPERVDYYVISNHRTYSGAERAFRKRNWWLYNRERARRMGYANTGTFDRIIKIVDGKVVDYNYTEEE